MHNIDLFIYMHFNVNKELNKRISKRCIKYIIGING